MDSLPPPPSLPAPQPASKAPLFVAGGVLAFCLVCLLGAWLHPESRPFLEGAVTAAFEQKAPADVGNPKSHAGPTCSFHYPGNWELTPDPEFGPGLAYEVAAPAQGSVNLFLLPPDTDLASSVEVMVAQFESQGLLIQNSTRHPLEAWGPHAAEGVELRGTIVLMPARIRVAAVAGEKAAVVVCELRFDEDERMAKPGFDLIAESFELGVVESAD